MKYSHTKPPRRGRRGKNLWLWLAIIAIIAGALFFWYRESRHSYLISTPVDIADDTPIPVSIKKGAMISDIGAILKEKDLILDEEAFRRHLKDSGLDRRIVAGRFMLDKTRPITEIAEIITDRRQSEFIITVPEGSTVRDIDARLTEMEVMTAGDFIAAVKAFDSYEKYPFIDRERAKKLEYPLEGYLFPDTYFLDPENFYSENLIQLMLKNFSTRLGDDLEKDHGRSLADIVTMASIIEKEVRTEKDRAVVSGILWKRLDQRWMLGADATLLYLKDDRAITYRDLKAESPYNTRNRTGLPPGPICNPGLKSIRASLNPENSPYYFYLTTPGAGEVIYAVTNDEHNGNKVKYL